MNIPFINSAALLAFKYHKDQIRKGDNTPYFIHPVMVANILIKHNLSDDTIAAGYCHDLIEDTPCTEAEIIQSTNRQVLEIVKAVTHDPQFNEKVQWEEQRLVYIESVRNGPIEAKAVCCADKMHNCIMLNEALKREGSIVWERFNRGKDNKEWFEREVLKMLRETWDHPMIDEYEKLLEEVI